MSPGGTDASLLELAVGFVVAVSLIAAITVILRRRSGSRDLLGTQVREMRERAAAAASPDADSRVWDAAGRIADARIRKAAAADDPYLVETPCDAPGPGAPRDAPEPTGHQDEVDP
ncbi:hypothetical protein Ait01nite_014990 [Actinoplanes italicus]|uniref:Uncharacterized protein n=1 Tax=Actinoplanes italicus TaxID=113567 RepID=A0A2T0KHL8_9ACTN|nr:hypothetical protein [Actinoplanes italicus]PRX22932.1 hypothetical protein CLV67_104460 [Actinoplanes italicus]GIE28454.1 hypothetical protein Ait01nite_014990 [Actinoplanes italicus]